MNQNEVDSYDQHEWRCLRQALYDQIKNLSTRNNFGFVHLDKINSSSPQCEVLVSALIYDLIPSCDWFNQLNSGLSEQSVNLLFFTDNILGESYKFSNIKIISLPQILGITANYSNISISTDIKKSKLFNCFIQRTDSVRQSWFYFLYYYNLIDRGYVSYLLKQLTDYSELTGQELFSWIHKQHKLGQLPHFQEAYKDLINDVPFRNFVENENLIPLILDSKYSVILETYANTDSDCWCFTEKSLRSLQLPTIDLMFLQSGGYNVLKNLGFELLDHSEFDHLPWQTRQQRLLDILVNDSIEVDCNILKQQALHNQDILLSWKKEIFSENFFDEYFENV